MGRSYRVRGRRRSRRASVAGAASVAALTASFGLPAQAEGDYGVQPWVKNPWTWIAADPARAVEQLADSRRGKNPLPAFGFASIKGCLVGDKWIRSCDEGGVPAPMDSYGYSWGDSTAQKVTVKGADGRRLKTLTMNASDKPGTTYLPTFQMKLGPVNPETQIADRAPRAVLIAPKIQCKGTGCDDSKDSQKIPPGAKLEFVPSGASDRPMRPKPAKGVKVEVPASFEREGFNVLWRKYQVEPDLTRFTRALSRAKRNDNPGTTKVNYSAKGNWIIETAERTFKIPSRFDYSAVFRDGRATDLKVSVVPRATSVNIFRIRDNYD